MNIFVFEHAFLKGENHSMELDDCAFPLLKGVLQTDSLEKGFEGVDYAFLVGAKPRGPGDFSHFS